MSRTSPPVTLDEVVDQIISSIERDDFKQARASLDPAAATVPELSRRFFLDMQSVNTGKLRDARLTLTRHDVVISFWVPTTHGPFSSVLRASFEREAHITDAIMARIRPWSGSYVDTRRKLNGTRELLGIDIRFRLESYHEMAY